MTSPGQPLVEFRGVEKRYSADARAAVTRLDLTVERGEFLTLLGPSGSGKTTTLMMLAGFEAPSAGDILLEGKSLADRPPYKRNMGVVFQNYALFPHMSVAENLAFPLGVRKIKGAAAKEKVDAALALVRLDGLGDRRPDALSGGQRQRVALARALIFEPDLVLMDEPLGALDRQLREHLQAEIKRIQRALSLTIVYVTHDQGEALTLSDRIAVFADGSIQQIGSPEQIYDYPSNAFVAGFVGENNMLSATVVTRQDRQCTIRLPGGQILHAVATGDIAAGDDVVAAIRPEHVQTGDNQPSRCNTLDARIGELVYHGDHSRIRAELDGGGSLVIRTPSRDGIAVSDRLPIGWCSDRCFAFPVPDITGVSTGNRI
ncbi:putative spermidine/putrescine transport system ATP-binding protein [Sphingopyxis panaciterrae]|uniref:ABC transporter ATP-binding protein n=1 Tax=Sphingopyxis panaciterrae TaxID=363841 RepID=UPI00141EDE2F|nr:ABC transporter ATP-binding protein [Sphingopyxis panaciterrae]NIJ39493.1 putative spermidine/putrescine transport system ATP-binding protein [Sphingopyxis panaciterrae]